MFKVFGFYKFVKVKSLKKNKDFLQKFLILNCIRGTIIIAKEGLNGTISGSIKDIMRQNKEIEAKNKAAKAKQGMKEQLESTGKFTAKEIENIIEKL